MSQVGSTRRGRRFEPCTAHLRNASTGLTSANRRQILARARDGRPSRRDRAGVENAEPTFRASPHYWGERGAMSRQGPPSGLRIVGTCLAVAVCVLLATGAAAGGGMGKPIAFTPGSAGAGDPYFPLDGNGGYDAEHYLLDLQYDPATDVIGGVRHDAGSRDPESVALQPRPGGPHRPIGGGERSQRGVASRRRRAGDHAQQEHSRTRALPHEGRLQRSARADRRRLRRQRLHPHRRWRPDHRRAPRRGHLVSRQRPSERQGVLHVPYQGSGRPRSGRQRHPPE